MDPDGCAVYGLTDNSAVQQTLYRLSNATRDESISLMPSILECVEAYATLGEISNVFRGVFGAYHEPSYF